MCCTGCRDGKTTSFKVLPVLNGARSKRGGEGDPAQFDGAPSDDGALRPARRTSRARSLRLSAFCASPGPPQMGDPSAPHARAPSLILLPLTACACSTPLQASTSRDWPRAASAARWAAGRRQAAFAVCARRLSRRAAARRALCASPWVLRGELGRYRHFQVEIARWCALDPVASPHWRMRGRAARSSLVARVCGPVCVCCV